MGPEDIIKKLNLVPLDDEGGYYKRTWTSDIELGGIPLGTAIYFLLINTNEGFSALHTLSTPEIYHFYLGDPFELSLFQKNGKVEKVLMGQDILNGEHLQFTVPGDVIQGSKIIGKGEYALMGTTMAPGFILEDFTLNSRKEMVSKYPEHENLIVSLTRCRE
ncbi:MAG: cupin domain-containing protein [Spirochaetales bacterium]|nr:cupin domain-containing protein [Spirochaetales bacterium]